jgi:hypothetical protein
MTDGPDETLIEEKPHRGGMSEWRFLELGPGRRIVVGRFVDHYLYGGLRGHTSLVERYDESTGEVETRNSRYTLVGPGRVGEWPQYE